VVVVVVVVVVMSRFIGKNTKLIVQFIEFKKWNTTKLTFNIRSIQKLMK
jgi:hypothetical protein